MLEISFSDQRKTSIADEFSNPRTLRWRAPPESFRPRYYRRSFVSSPAVLPMLQKSVSGSPRQKILAHLKTGFGRFTPTNHLDYVQYLHLRGRLPPYLIPNRNLWGPHMRRGACGVGSMKIVASFTAGYLEAPKCG